MQSEILLRLAPTLAPIMHRVDVFTHFFFVPIRLIWDEWEAFVTKGTTGELAPAWPVLSAQYVDVGPNSLASHLVMPVQNLDSSNNGKAIPNVDVYHSNSFDALPFRAYQLIYDEYYRDQNLQVPLFRRTFDNNGSPVGAGDSPKIPMSSGLTDNPWQCRELSAIRTRAWEKDYFTSALPWTQRGEEVKIGMAYGDLPIEHKNPSLPEEWGSPTASGTTLPVGDGVVSIKDNILQNPNGARLQMDTSNLVAKLGAAQTTINELRRAFKLQEFLERNARGGSRYVETILSHFGVKSSDSRMQRPIYLGGGKSPVIISEVVQTSSSTDGSPQGNMSGHGVSAQVTHKWKHFFEEHGLVLGILSVMPKPAYMNGTPRIYLKRDVYDLYWPEFAHIGEQAIEEQEIYTDWSKKGAGNTNPSESDYNGNNKVFGYTPRYAEYKFIPSNVSGDMAKSLDFWHLARNFDSAPNLNGNFVASGIPQHRIFAVADGTDNCWIQIYNKILAKRPMPKFGVPTM